MSNRELAKLVARHRGAKTKKTKKKRVLQAIDLRTQELVAAPESQSERLDPPAVMVGKRRLDEPKRRY